MTGRGTIRRHAFTAVTTHSHTGKEDNPAHPKKQSANTAQQGSRPPPRHTPAAPRGPAAPIRKRSASSAHIKQLLRGELVASLSGPGCPSGVVGPGPAPPVRHTHPPHVSPSSRPQPTPTGVQPSPRAVAPEHALRAMQLAGGLPPTTVARELPGETRPGYQQGLRPIPCAECPAMTVALQQRRDVHRRAVPGVQKA